MATDKVAIETPKLESCSPAGSTDTSVQMKILQVPSKCAPISAVQPTASAAAARGVKADSVSAPPKIIPATQGLQPSSSTVTVSTLPTSSPSVMVIAKVATPGGVSTKVQTQVTKPALNPAASAKQVSTPGRTVVIRAAAPPQTVAVAPRITQTASPKLTANIQIPAGMMLIQSDSGQLMLVCQQALAQAQQGPRAVSGQVSRVLAPQASASGGNKSQEKVTVIRMAAPPSRQPAPVQKTAVVKQETLESVKKCKNFLVTLIKLASNDPRSANMANNVKGLVKSLLEGKLEAEEFTEQLYQELKSTPQPCLVPFLKKSLPAVRRLTADPQLFIQQALTSSSNTSTQSSIVKQSSVDTGQTSTARQQVVQQSQGVTLTSGLMTLAQSRNYISKSSRPSPKHTVVQAGKHFTGTFSPKQPFPQDPSRATKSGFNDGSGSYKEDDDINDVASMAGVNLREENAQILTTMVGSVVQSCQDQLFLSPSPVLSRILHTGQGLGITDVGPDVVAVVSHATQECLRGLIEKLTVIAEHRKAALKEDLWHAKVSDVRAQLRFMEEVESLKKKRKDEEERERLLRLARSRSHAEDPEHQQLKQRAKELQQIEEAQLQQREANLTALAAIGPRKKRPLEQTENQVTLLPRQGVQRVTRVTLRDLLVCMEQHRFLRHSLTLYKAML